MTSELVRVPPEGPLRDAVLRLAPRPDHELYSGRATETLPVAEQDPSRHPFTLVENGAPIGFFVLDETPADADTSADLLLRAFFVDAAAQGRGRGGRMVALLPDLVREHFPAARSVVLTVNVRNVVARALYVAGGFVDAGELYLGGPAGPQHVLRLDLPTVGGPAARMGA